MGTEDPDTAQINQTSSNSDHEFKGSKIGMHAHVRCYLSRLALTPIGASNDLYRKQHL